MKNFLLLILAFTLTLTGHAEYRNLEGTTASTMTFGPFPTPKGRVQIGAITPDSIFFGNNQTDGPLNFPVFGSRNVAGGISSAAVIIQSGNSTGADSGTVFIQSGTGASGTGDIELVVGTGGTPGQVKATTNFFELNTRSGNDFTFTTEDSGGATSENIFFRTGNNVGAGTSGTLNIITGETTGAAANSGEITIQTGEAPGAGSNTANIAIESGDKDTADGATGDVFLRSGNMSGAITGATGGSFIASGSIGGGGTGSTGAVSMISGNNAGTGNSGELTVLSGTAVNGTTGNVTIGSGSNATTGNSGAISIASGNTADGNPGTVTILTGNRSGAGATGIITIASGNPTNGASGLVQISSGQPTAGNSGEIVIDSGNAAAGNSGNITLLTGSASGTRGSVIIDAPIVTGSHKWGEFASSDTGDPLMWTGRFNCDGASVITAQSGNFTTIGNIAAGACTVSYNAVTTIYGCTVSGVGLTNPNQILSVATTAVGSVSVDCDDTAGTDCAAFDFTLVCSGLK